MMRARNAAISLTLASWPFASTLCAQPWKLKWSDEFDSRTAGVRPDPTKWTYDVGDDGWGNQELERYCAPGDAKPPCDPKRPNAYLDGKGHLVIEAIRTASGAWTSARLKSEGLAEFQYGRIEARMKLPVGAGLWPAFWMLGVNHRQAGWPGCGEIDFMENVPAIGDNPLGPGKIRSTVHGTGYSGGGGVGMNFTFPNGGRVDTDFHTYGALWSKGKIEFYVDDWRKPFFTATPRDVPAGSPWNFEAPFFMILNLAVGGGWPGNPDGQTPNPARIVVDHVRVYERAPAAHVRLPQLKSFETR